MKRLFDEPFDNHYDMIIIGGGITGVSTAYEASSRGMKVVLFEKGDFGEATSAATSKLIHGGLRYLKNLEFLLVRESLTERRTLENIAPNFVYPIPFMIPTYNNLKNNKVSLFIGMILYDMLSLDKGWTWDKSKKLPLHRTISSKRTKKLEEVVPVNKLTGSSIFYDCQNINPERLTLGVLNSAIANGAKAANYTKVQTLIMDEKTVKGVRVVDNITNKTYEFTADITINCTGPWSDIVINSATIDSEKHHHIRRSEGIHLITRKLCNTHVVSMMTETGRHVMMIPWRNHTLIGTTDKAYHGNPDDYKVSKESIQELLDEINMNYGTEKIKYSDIQYAYGGMRPLVDNQTEESYESSRKYEIFDNAKQGLDGLLTAEGGKYTTSRKLAYQIMKKVSKKLNRKLAKFRTKKTYLVDSHIKDMEGFMEKLENNYPDFSKETINYLGRNYGLKSHAIFELARKDNSLSSILTKDGEILAEVVYAIKEEMVLSLSDILFRRTGIGTLGYPGDQSFQKVVDTAKKYLQWDDEKTQAEIGLVMEKFRLPE